MLSRFGVPFWTTFFLATSIMARTTEQHGAGRMRLLFAAAICLARAAAAARDSYTCKTADDCERLGTCVAGQCHCQPGFTGDSCGVLDLAPAPALQSTSNKASAASPILWPQMAQLADNSTFSWGFSAVQDDDGLYHAVVNVGCCRQDTCGVTVGGTYLVHLVSSHPNTGFTAKGVFTVPTTFNPHLIRALNGTFVLYFRVNDMGDYTVCQGDGTQTNSSSLKTYINRADMHPGDGEGPGANMYAAWADTMDGPWQVRKVDINGMGDLHISNPSVIFTQAGSAWPVMLAYRYNPSHGEANGIAVAHSFLGPFQSLANISKAPGNDEDPYLWQSAYDQSYHIVYHNGDHGYHAFSADGKTWLKSPTHSHAFSLTVQFQGGQMFSFSRRERPDIFWNTNRTAPLYLYNGVNTHDGKLPPSLDDGVSSQGFSHAFSFVEPFKP